LIDVAKWIIESEQRLTDEEEEEKKNMISPGGQTVEKGTEGPPTALLCSGIT